MWMSPTTWYLDEEGNLTDKPGENHRVLISHMPLEDAVKLGIAEKDGTAIPPKKVMAERKTKKE